MNQDQVDAVVERMEAREAARCEAVRDRDDAEPSKLEVELSISTLHRRMLRQAEVLARGNKRERARAAEIVRSVEVQRADLRNIRSVNASIAETTALAERRDETVTVEGAVEGEWARDDRGVLLRGSDGMPVFRSRAIQRTRISSRDGLISLFEAKRLDVRQLEAGVRYRRYFEAGSGDLRSQLGAEGNGGDRDLETSRLHQAAMLTWRVRVDRKVALECCKRPNALKLLREVAGVGHTINWVIEDDGKPYFGKRNERYIADLRMALEIAARVFKLVPVELADHAWRPFTVEVDQASPVTFKDETFNYVSPEGLLLYVVVRKGRRAG